MTERKITAEFVEKWAQKVKKELEDIEHICDHTIADCLFWMFRELKMWSNK
jgi:hypothetical protein